MSDIQFCDACAMGKLHSINFPSVEVKTSSPFQLVHTDVWGPSSTLSSEGFKYYVAFVDDYTRFTWIFPLTVKSEVLAVFKKFLLFVERQFDVKIKAIQSDWGGEFRPLKPVLESLGITFRHPCPHTHQQNGRVERKHRHITELGLTLLAKASLPQKFWWDAFTTATYLINRLPTPSLQHKSPYLSLHKTLPDYTFLKPFGCACFPFLRPYNTSKIQFRSSKCLFLGYSPLHKGYRCLHPSGRIYTARSVVFNETEFPYLELFPTSPVTSVSNFSSPHMPIPPLLPIPISPPSSQNTQSSSTSSQPSSNQSHSPSRSPSHSPSPHNSSHSSSQQNSSNSSSSSILLPPKHHMNTRSKSGIFRPKVFKAITTSLPVSSKISEPLSDAEALNHPLWHKAISAEIDAIKTKQTWDIVPLSPDMNPIDCKWVYRVKLNADDSLDKLKARLVAKGFQQLAGLDFLETFSPVVKPVSVRLLFSLAASFHWDIQHIDINNAFLHGYLDRPVYMRQPPGFEDPTHPDWVCKLKKSLYGLKQAPRAWYERLKTHLLRYGFKCSASDHSFFHLRREGKLLFVLVYVDDILITGEDPQLNQQFIQTLSDEFALKTLGSVSFFLGIEVSRHHDKSFTLSQAKYIRDLLHKTKLLDSNPQASPYDSGLKLHKSDSPLFADPTLYRSTIGALQYLTITRPDISFMVNKLSQFMQNPTEWQWKACKRLLRYLKGTSHYSLRYSPSSYLSLTAFSDADWAGSVDDRKSTGGYFVFLGSNLLSWSSKKQSVVSRSSTEAEYRALADAAMEVVWVKSLLQEVGFNLTQTPVIWCDNRSAAAMASNPVLHARTKHIEIDVHFVRDKVLKKDLDVRHITSDEQVADVLTKPVSITRFQQLVRRLPFESG